MRRILRRHEIVVDEWRHLGEEHACDADALIAGVERLWRDPDLAREMGTSGQRYAREVLTASTTVDEIDRALSALV